MRAMFFIIVLLLFIHAKAKECPDGQVWNECGSSCNVTCVNPFPFCKDQCVQRCQCPEDRPVQKVEDGVISCTPREDCCVGDMIWGCKPTPTSCHPSCPLPHMPTLLPVACTEECAVGCQCKQQKPIEIFDRNQNLVCISQDKCPVCQGGQVYVKCGSSCTRSCDFLHPRCEPDCVSRCQCPPNKPLWHNGQCTTEDMCPKQGICKQDTPVSPCSSRVPRWTYLSGFKECIEILHNACVFPSESNLFISDMDCHKACDSSECPFVDCSSSQCPAGFKTSEKGCRSEKCECNCPCKKVKCGKGEECIPMRPSSTCPDPPCKPEITCQATRCPTGVVVSQDLCGNQTGKLDCFNCKLKYGNYFDCCTENLCHLPPDSGCGKKKTKRWFFDFDNQECHQFRYGGKAGNGNNFKSEKTCLNQCLSKKCKSSACSIVCEAGFKQDNNGCKICQCNNPCEGRICEKGKKVSWRVVPCLVPPCPILCGCDLIKSHICHLPIERGQCGSLIRRYGYDGTQCKAFTYSGCGGNRNNFETLSQCVNSCGDEGDKCLPLPVPCDKSCPRGLMADQNGCLLCQCKDPCFGKMCSDSEVCQVLPFFCVNSPCADVTPMCVAKKCKIGSPLQDGRNGDLKCTKKKSCPNGYVCSKGVCCASSECMLPADSGPCTKHMRQFYFNSSTGTCETFIYGGCGGNGNRFSNHGRCVAKCNSRRHGPQ